MAYETADDSWDDYLRMSERTGRECLYKFCKCVVKLYSKKYLRAPTASDIQKLYQAHEQRHGFPGLLGSIDCMHWAWHNCLNACRGLYALGDHGHPTILLEAVASQDLWIWHVFFGVPGSNNVINVINQVEVFNDVIKGIGPDTSLTVSGVEYMHMYYLADGICPSFSTIVKTIPHPYDKNRKKFAKIQEAARKDIERCFRVLQKRWNIIENPARAFELKKLRYYIYACILLHNMIIEDEGRTICEYDENSINENFVPISLEQQDLNSVGLKNEYTNANLQADLVEYILNFTPNEDDED